MRFVIENQGSDKLFRWRLYPEKGMAVACSAQGYATMGECIESIQRVKQAALATTDDLTTKEVHADPPRASA